MVIYEIHEHNSKSAKMTCIDNGDDRRRGLGDLIHNECRMRVERSTLSTTGWMAFKFVPS